MPEPSGLCREGRAYIWRSFIAMHHRKQPSLDQALGHMPPAGSPVTFTPNIAFRNPPLETMKEFRSFEHQLPPLLAGSHNKCCVPLHHGPVSVIWLCFLVGKKIQVLFDKTVDASNSKNVLQFTSEKMLFF